MDEVFDERIRRIDKCILHGKRPRDIGFNARIAAHGSAITDPVVRLHTIAHGDTLGGLSQLYYGTTTKWQAIQDANPGISELKMPIGKAIVIPNLGRGRPAVVDSGRTHTVREGDNPARISKRYFKTEKYADLIMQSNGIKDARKLRIGTVLQIPVPPVER